MKEQRDVWVDHAKGVGIILVVYGHVLIGMLKVGLFPEPAIHELLFSIIYTFHMPLFFFLAGLYFDASLKKRGGTLLFANKIDTIVYPYLVWSVLQYSIQIFFSDHTNYKISYERIPFLLLMSGAQFWFLYTLFFIFVVCIAIRNYFPSKAFLYVFMVFLVIYINQEMLSGWLSQNRFYISIMFFIGGIFFNSIRNRFYISSNPFFYFLIFVFSAGQYLFHYMLGHDSAYIGIELIVLAVISVLFVCSLCMRIKSDSLRWLVFLGKNSMPIYLMNILGTAGARIILVNYMGVKDVYIHVFAGFMIGLIGPVVFYRLSQSLHFQWLFELDKKYSLEYLIRKNQ